MAILSFTEMDEVVLILRGAHEDAILNTLRHWPHWQRAEVERDPHDPSRCVSVTLVTDRTHEDTVRLVLERSFGLRFPAEGGSVAFEPPPVPAQRKRR